MLIAQQNDRNMPNLGKSIKAMQNIVLNGNEIKINQKFLYDVYEFCKTAQMLRTGYNCSRFYNNVYSEKECEIAINLLFHNRKMGAYYFEKDADPQKYMRQYIISNISTIDFNSKILEIGPGNLPLFSEIDYKNWRGIDYNNVDGTIFFAGKEWNGGGV